MWGFKMRSGSSIIMNSPMGSVTLTLLGIPSLSTEVSLSETGETATSWGTGRRVKVGEMEREMLAEVATLFMMY